MAYLLRISATVSYTDNSIGYIAIVVDENGNVLTNDSSNHPIDISNVNTYTNSFDGFPVPALLDFLNLNISDGAKEISEIVMGVLAVDNKEQCYILYNDGVWDVYGDINVALNLFENSSESIGEALDAASLNVAPRFDLVINNDVTALLKPNEQKVLSYTNPGAEFPVFIKITNNIDDSSISVENVQELSDPDDNYDLVSGAVQTIGPSGIGNVVFTSAFDAGTHLGQYRVTVNGTPFTLTFGITLSETGGGR